MNVTTVIRTSVLPTHPHLASANFIRLLPVAKSAHQLITHSHHRTAFSKINSDSFNSVRRTDEGVGNLRKCGMRKVICGIKSAEVGCGTVGNMQNAE